MAVSWKSCTTPSTRAPMSMAAPRLVFCACLVRNRESRAELAGSGLRTGHSSSLGIIPVISRGTSSNKTNGGLMTTEHCQTRITAGPCAKATHCSRGSFVVDDVGGGCPSVTLQMAQYHHMSATQSTLIMRARPASRYVVMKLMQRSREPFWKPCDRLSSRSRWPPSIRSPPRHVSSIASGN
jgi:hypothetical protein